MWPGIPRQEGKCNYFSILKEICTGNKDGSVYSLHAFKGFLLFKFVLMLSELIFHLCNPRENAFGEALSGYL